MTKVYQNAVRLIASNEILISRHVHDFIGFTVDDEQGFIDGGHEYLRYRMISGVEKLFITSTTPMEERVQKAIWGTRGKDGKQPLKYVFLNDCTTDHLKAILKTQKHIKGLWIEDVIKQILLNRGVNKDSECSV